MPALLSADVCRRYRRLTLYNSPYVAHDGGRAVDLYPGDPTHPDPVDGPPVSAPSPVAGEVVDTRTVTAPERPYAAESDHLLVVDVGDSIARVLHVDPIVQPGDRIAVGDSLGTLVRAGYFAPWVANHIHLEFRDNDANPYRASGSRTLMLDSGLDVEAVEWDSTGTVTATGDTYAVLDAPDHPCPGECFAGLVAKTPAGEPLGVLDGGLPHYDWGGIVGTDSAVGPTGTGRNVPVCLAGQRVGRADGRDVTWDDVSVRANGQEIGGIALSLGLESAAVKLVGESVDLAVGEDVTVSISQ